MSQFSPIIGESPQMQQVLAQIRQAAPVKTTVLLIGESGTGKEMVARALHEGSPRRGEPFLALNCGAIPENLIESTLFGHEKGAFTGADKAQRGYFQAATAGTLLLDEIGELPLGLQTKLLRVLEDGTVTPVGTTAAVKVDVRIVAATNRSPEADVKEGKFRQDLFYRLNVLRIEVPPLRKRLGDIPLLVEHFLKKIAAELKDIEPKPVEPAVLQHFKSYHWPGNVRELRNALERMMVLAKGPMLTEDDLPDAITSNLREQVANSKSNQDFDPAEVTEKVLKAYRSSHGLNRKRRSRAILKVFEDAQCMDRPRDGFRVRDVGRWMQTQAPRLDLAEATRDWPEQLLNWTSLRVPNAGREPGSAPQDTPEGLPVELQLELARGLGAATRTLTGLMKLLTFSAEG